MSSKSSTELEITWDSPPLAHWNSEYLSYKIGYKYTSTLENLPGLLKHTLLLNREVGETTGLKYIDLHSSNELTHRFVLGELKKFSSYQVLVQAYNKQGIGPASTPGVATTMEDSKYRQFN